MKFTLKDYQEDAVRDVLRNMRKARERWHESDPERVSFSLTATTGAGKTVMAAAVFEALFHGDENYDFEPDRGAVVIWFSDDPSLNEQTRFRLMEASDRIHHGDLVVVDSKFQLEKFRSGKVYFLNTQKLGKHSLLVRGHDSSDPSFEGMKPDNRQTTIWDTIQNTIDDPNLTLYLVLDEAHRGMGQTTEVKAERSTIVKRLINGDKGIPAMPIVWGISATIERFKTAMKEADGRSTLPDIVVDSAKVQESGLLKDTIILDVPNEVGLFDTVLVRRAADKLKESTAAWAAYSLEQGLSHTVRPLMVLQVPNTPDHDEIGRAIDTIRERCPDLGYDSFAHVFGDHTKQTFGGHTVDHISPERVQDATHIRVLIAKDAISTGWDCPRAEVMVSFRPAKDRTHITQLLGRMVRTPLARRVPGNDRLNSVNCLLPFFDLTTVEEVADSLMKGGEGGDTAPPIQRVLINPRELKPNPAISAAVWDKFTSLPSQSLPRKAAKPVKRLTALAHELAADGLKKDAGKLAHAELHKVLDAAKTRYAVEIAARRAEVYRVEGKSLKTGLFGEDRTFADFVELADRRVIEDAYRRAARGLGADLAKSYVKHVAGQSTDEDDYLMAEADIAALGLVPDVKEDLEREAEKLANNWLQANRVPIKDLGDERQDVYRGVQAMSVEPQDIGLMKPKATIEAHSAKHDQGQVVELPSYENHLMCDAEGKYPADMNEAEKTVLGTEMGRSGYQGWYRNPARPSQDSLGIAYSVGDQYKTLRPDFIFFSESPDGRIVADLVDPHGAYLADALPKLKGMADFAERLGHHFRRIEVVEKVGEEYRVLDLKDAGVRAAVAAADNAKALYESSISSDYA
ncbi:MAG: DEAD/DEAH box helicase family protein [Fimbriimonadaceae bacterium]